MFTKNQLGILLDNYIPKIDTPNDLTPLMLSPKDKFSTIRGLFTLAIEEIFTVEQVINTDAFKKYEARYRYKLIEVIQQKEGENERIDIERKFRIADQVKEIFETLNKSNQESHQVKLEESNGGSILYFKGGVQELLEKIEETCFGISHEINESIKTIIKSYKWIRDNVTESQFEVAFFLTSHKTLDIDIEETTGKSVKYGGKAKKLDHYETLTEDLRDIAYLLDRIGHKSNGELSVKRPKGSVDDDFSTI